jgi:hypothetical protein
MMVKHSLFPMRRSAALFSLLLVVCQVAPAHAEEASGEGKVLTMTGLKRDSVKLTTEVMSFTGLRRHSAVMSPNSSEKKNPK